MISEYLTQVFAVASLTLFLALAGTGYLYKESLKTNGGLTSKIESLQFELATCRGEVDLIQKDKEDLEASIETVEKKNEELIREFGMIEQQLSVKKCRGTIRNEKPVDINVADDIADTLRLLREASCLSNKDCKRP